MIVALPGLFSYLILDKNAECKDSICQCIVEFSDINGTCKAGKPITDVDQKVFHSFEMLSIVFQSYG